MQIIGMPNKYISNVALKTAVDEIIFVRTNTILVHINMPENSSAKIYVI